jgi:hypothetical protein
VKSVRFPGVARKKIAQKKNKYGERGKREE